MANLPLDARVLLESGGLAHMVTLNADGWPQVSCVWVGLDGDEIVSGHLPRNQKVKNVERDPRVVISMEGAKDNELGLRESFEKRIVSNEESVDGVLAKLELGEVDIGIAYATDIRRSGKLRGIKMPDTVDVKMR